MQTDYFTFRIISQAVLGVVVILALAFVLWNVANGQSHAKPDDNQSVDL